MTRLDPSHGDAADSRGEAGQTQSEAAWPQDVVARQLRSLPREDARPAVRARLLASTLVPARAGWLERLHQAVERSFAHRAAWGAAACALVVVGVGFGLRPGVHGRLDTATPGALAAQPVAASNLATGDAAPVNFYVAYYNSQRSGASIHSPRSCMPGGGWQITSLSQRDLSPALGMDGPTVNRTIIQLGEQRQLVYYWFQQRGRIITNEYLAKWYLFQDGLTMNRSDGALVRLVTPLPPYSDEAQADERLQAFIKDFYPELPRFVPGANGPVAGAGG